MSSEHVKSEVLVAALSETIADERVLAALREVPRHLFVPAHLRHLAYADRALPIGHGQTISQPSIVALTLQALELRGDECVLDVGTGSGYQAALLAKLCSRVYSVEIVPQLLARARVSLTRAGIEGVELHVGDGGLGFPPGAPFDGIVVAAAAPNVPRELIDQLAEGGRLIIPLGTPDDQVLTRFRKSNGAVTAEPLMSCVFVPLLGERGGSEDWHA